MKKYAVGIITLIIVFMIAYAVARGTSYDRTESKAGMNERGHLGYPIHYGKDMEGNDIEVRFAPVISGEDVPTMSIAVFTETPFWGWSLTRRVMSKPGDTSIMLTFGRSSTVFGYGYEKHLIYAGNNAVREIDSITDILPPNITVDIISYPDSPYYCLHFMSYDEYEIDPGEMLRQKGYIE